MGYQATGQGYMPGQQSVTQRERGNMKNERLQKLVTTVAVSAGGLALLAGGLLWWASHWTRTALLAVVTLAPFVVALAFGAGFWFGKTEVRGFLGGFDRALDGLSKAVDLRDNARLRTAAAARQADQPAAYLPVYQIPVSHREQRSSEIIDL